MWKIGDHVEMGIFSVYSPFYQRQQLYFYGIAKRVTTQTQCDIFIQIVNRINIEGKLFEGMSFTKISTTFDPFLTVMVITPSLFSTYISFKGSSEGYVAP